MSKTTDATQEPWAFPVPDQQDLPRWPGMTLRDYFAGQALAGMHNYYQHEEGGIDFGFSPSYMAEEAYRIADAMLAARQGKYGE